MLDTFKARLKAKAKAAGANLSQKRIDAIADRLHKKYADLTDEAEHDTKIDDLYEEQDLKDFAAADDYQRAKDAKAAKDKADKAKAGSDSDDQPKSEIDELKELVRGLATTVQTMNQEKQQQSIQQKLGQHEKLKDINKTFWSKRALPTKDEDIDAFVEEVTTDHAAFLQESGYSNIGDHKPPASTEKPIPGKAKVDPALVAYAKKQNEKALASKK
jgi:hypothetical protein